MRVLVLFYDGLSAELLRQVIYTTAQLGSFRIRVNKATDAYEGKLLTLYQKALFGLTAGAIGACADLSLTHMQADDGPTVVTVSLNVGMSASYEQSVEFLKDNLGMGDAATSFGTIKAGGSLELYIGFPVYWVQFSLVL
ncbi:hypothetical protein RND71_009449 [Anisodus tanguticus]|uniref:Uncharacterized protein n=1 Tax=Anisodus tanguticus TaxID=243964 RepID=A0AAE1SFU5_9SOLA|nr:hypothetical protein RND71_009449 [Anisodus tanguticus]